MQPRTLDLNLDEIDEPITPETLTEKQRTILKTKVTAEKAFAGRLEQLRELVGVARTREEMIGYVDAAIKNCQQSEARFKELLERGAI